MVWLKCTHKWWHMFDAVIGRKHDRRYFNKILFYLVIKEEDDICRSSPEIQSNKVESIVKRRLRGPETAQVYRVYAQGMSENVWYGKLQKQSMALSPSKGVEWAVLSSNCATVTTNKLHPFGVFQRICQNKDTSGSAGPQYQALASWINKV